VLEEEKISCEPTAGPVYVIVILPEFSAVNDTGNDITYVDEVGEFVVRRAPTTRQNEFTL
jgi:hypothetical protein